MVVKVYISGISGNKEVKKRQQRVLLILDSKNIKYEVIDIAEPNAEEAKDFMQNNSTMSGGTISDPNPRHPLPPQMFNDDIYCGDYDAFDMANEIDEMEKFLKLELDEAITSIAEIKLGNGEVVSDDLQPEEEKQIEVVQDSVNDKSELPDNEDAEDLKDLEEKAGDAEVEENQVPKTEEIIETNENPKADKIAEGENETDDQKVENGTKHEVGESESATEKSEET